MRKDTLVLLGVVALFVGGFLASNMLAQPFGSAPTAAADFTPGPTPTPVSGDVVKYGFGYVVKTAGAGESQSVANKIADINSNVLVVPNPDGFSDTKYYVDGILDEAGKKIEWYSFVAIQGSDQQVADGIVISNPIHNSRYLLFYQNEADAALMTARLKLWMTENGIDKFLILKHTDQVPNDFIGSFQVLN